MKTKTLSNVVLDWLEDKSQKKIASDDLLYGELINSLELLELLTFIEMELNIQIQLTHLPPSSFRTVFDLLSTVEEYSNKDSERRWYLVKTSKDIIEFRMWIEFQFDRKIAFKLNESEILIGIPAEIKNFNQILTKIENEVDYIERYQIN